MRDERNATSGTQPWGIYHTDREDARIHGDPLRTLVEASTKLDAEEEAARLGFSASWAHPVTQEETQHGERIANQRTRTQQVITKPTKRSIRV